MGTTPRGYPYPEPADPIAAGAAAIKALAEAIESRAPRTLGTAVSVTISNAVSGSATVTYPVGRFTAAPAVTATPNGTTSWIAAVNGGTAAGVTVVAFTRSGAASSANLTVFVTAIQG